MNDENGSEEEVGRPIAEIAELQQEVQPGFLVRLRRRIERRSLTSQFLGFSWHFPKLILIELLEIVFSLFTPRNDRGGGPK